MQISLPIYLKKKNLKYLDSNDFLLHEKHLKVAPIDVTRRFNILTYADGGEERGNDLKWRLSDAMIL